MTELSWIFIVGPAASGKSTFAGELSRRFSQFEYSSDLRALEELFYLNDQLIEYTRDFTASLEVLTCSLNTIVYWPDLRDLRLLQLKEGGLTSPLETTRTTDGGHRIHEPTVWDSALSRTVAQLSPSSKHIVEFARGVDEAYLSHFRIDASDIYPRAFRLLASVNREITQESSIIVHLTAKHLVRMRRNELRKLRGEHFVSRETMDKVYATDAFVFECLNAPGPHDGRLSASLPVPVLTVDNNSEDPIGNFAKALEYLSKIITFCRR